MAASNDLLDLKGSQSTPPRRAYVGLAILCIVYVLNIMDRQMIAILSKPIQESMHISDGQLGLLGGLYFALFYCFISIPIGWLADRISRIKVIAAACALWSAATMGCGLSSNFAQLALSRMAVGVGEAGGVPPSYAIITDYFPPGRRGAAISIFNLGPPLGQALGVAVGASVAAAYSWRQAFLGVGAAGVIAAVLAILFVKEPARGGLDRTPDHQDGALAITAPFLETIRQFFTTPVLFLTALASGATQIVAFGTTSFSALFLMREKGMTLHQVSIFYAAMVGVCMSLGILCSGRIIDRYVRRSKAVYAVIPAISLTLAAPFFLGFLLAPSWPLALALLAGPTSLNYFYLSASVALVQEEVRPEQRVLSGALLLLIMNLIGLGVGPTYVGAMSDFLRSAHPHHSLQFALLALLPFYTLAIVLFGILALVLRRGGGLGRFKKSVSGPVSGT